MKQRARPDDSFENYTHVVVNVDDNLVICHNAISDLKSIGYYFKMKEDSIGDPDSNLGSRIRNVVLSNLVEAWMMAPT